MVGKCYNFLSLLILESLVGLRQIRLCPHKPGFQWPFGNSAGARETGWRCVARKSSRPKPESCRSKFLVKSPKILIKSVCNISRSLSDNETKQAG